MSEMNTPLQWTPRASGAALSMPLDPEHGTQRDFSWPLPAEGAYASPLVEPPSLSPCTVVGTNGKLMAGRLVRFAPDEGVAYVQLPPSRSSVALRFSQFRSLVLEEPLRLDAAQADDTLPAALDDDAAVGSPYRLSYVDGDEAQGLTLAPLIESYGLFLFVPVDGSGAVQRCFVPRSAYASFRFADDLLLSSPATAAPPAADAAPASPGSVLPTQQVSTTEQLLAAIEQQSRMPMVRVGEALLSLGLVSQDDLDRALAQQRNDRGVPLGELLVRSGSVSRQDLQTALARKMGYPLVDVALFPCEVAAVRAVPYSLAHKLKALPLVMLRSGRLVVALEDPAKTTAIAELEFAAQAKIVPVLAACGSVDTVLRNTYDKAGATIGAKAGAAAIEAINDFEPDDTGRLIESLEREGLDRAQADDERQIEQSDNSLVRLINNMIIEAWNQGVSDIHVESYPGREKIKIRFRKDGVLQPYLELPYTYRNAMIARIKIMCDLDISERRKPQDGKINFARFAASHRLELRVATIPTANGLEDVVMRILASAKPLPLAQLGLSPRNHRQLNEACERPYGLILCVGPTGSGKTTTLHSALAHINKPERKIWTAEDPVEITQTGLRQVQVNPKIDWTFAKALRAFLRADPDVIMVGEIRDEETASMAIEASLTGHLVMSTLHTNSAPETVTRLLDMGMDPFNFADSLLMVLAQRLVRRLCTHCRTSRPASADETEELLADYLHVCPTDDARYSRDGVMRDWLERFGVNGRLMRHASPGCAACGHTGLKGRAGLHELMSVNRELRQMIQTGERSVRLQRAAMDAGMRTLRQDGIDKVWAGVTTIDEVRAMSNA